MVGRGGGGGGGSSPPFQVEGLTIPCEIGLRYLEHTLLSLEAHSNSNKKVSTSVTFYQKILRPATMDQTFDINPKKLSSFFLVADALMA